jgi:ABC-2 type transport system permease protein
VNDINKIQEKESIASKFKASFASKKFKGGAYATTISVVVIVLIILVNVFVTELNIKIDVSNQNMYTLTGESKDYVNGIKDDITIYYIAQSGKEDASIKEMIEKYASYSDNIKIEYKDPVLYPKFASEYTDAELTENSVLIVNNTNGRAKYVDNADMFVQEVDYQTYQSYVSAIDVEGQVTSALQYVTTENLPIMYMVEGHGETAVSETLASSLAKVNVKTNTLSTLTTKTIPEDCSILLINGPQTDYSEDEVKMIKDYLAKGGDAIVLVDFSVNGLTNLKGLIEYYGISFANGIVLESKQGYYMGQYVNNLVPNIESHDITTDIKADKASIVVPTAVGIIKSDSARSTITIDPILTTSDSSYSKVDVNSSVVDKEDGDIDGPFNLGVAITENYNDVETKLVVYGSSYIIDEGMVSYSALGNLDLFLNSVNFVSNKEESLAIRTRSVTQEYLTLNAAQVNFWAVIIIVIIPVLVLSIGGYICLRRRKK